MSFPFAPDFSCFVNTLEQFGWNFGPPSSAKRESFLEKVTYGFTGREYTAKDCKVISHKRIECKTVPGVGTHNIWQVKVAGQTNDVLASPVTDYAVPKCWAMYDMIGSEEMVKVSNQSPPLDIAYYQDINKSWPFYTSKNVS